jgi:hypothetical protein
MSTLKNTFIRYIDSRTRKAMREIIQDERIKKNPEKPIKKA